MWAVTNGALDPAPSSGKVFNLTHSMSLGEHKASFSAAHVEALESWYATHAVPVSEEHAPHSVEAQLGLRHDWRVRSTFLWVGSHSRGSANDKEGREFVYVGRALYTSHSPHLMSFQHYTFDGLPRMHIALQFLKNNPHVLVVCTGPRNVCQHAWEQAGLVVVVM
jgi:hypothetical protein